MLIRSIVSVSRSRAGQAVLLIAVLACAAPAFAQSGWLNPAWPDMPKGPHSAPEKTTPPGPAPIHSIAGTWGPRQGAGAGIQAGGVQAMPNDGKPEHQLPYTAHGLEIYKSHKALEGNDSVQPGQYNDPRDFCEPLGVPRATHYNLRLTQIYQDGYKVSILYQYDNRWRTIWTDGRQLPKVVDGGVELDGELREPRFYGYSVGKWVDNTTLVVQTVGTMPEDRVWLDSTGRPISDKVHVTETFHRVDSDNLEWSETIDDPVMYTKPWVSMNKFPLKLKDPRTDVMEYYCSPKELDDYNKLFFGGPAENKSNSAK